jgi:hypothetical protein
LIFIPFNIILYVGLFADFGKKRGKITRNGWISCKNVSSTEDHSGRVRRNMIGGIYFGTTIKSGHVW